MLQLFRRRTAATLPVVLLVSQDEETTQALEFYLGQQKFPPFHVMRRSRDEALRHLAENKAADLILIELEAAGDEDVRSLEELMHERAAAVPVIVVSPNVDETMVRLFLRLRVSDWLPKPAEPADVVEACRRAELTSAAPAGQETNCVTFLGAMGGVGTTTLAVNAAVLLSERRAKGKSSTCLVDLDFATGMCAEFLDLPPALQLEEVVPHPERLDAHLLGLMLSQSSQTLSLLSARTKLGEYGDIDPMVVAKLLDLAASRFGNVVIDLPRAWQPWTESVLLGSSVCYIVTEQTVPGLRSARRLVSEIRERAGEEVRLRVIINKHKRRLLRFGISRNEVAKILGDAFAGYVRPNPSLAGEAIDRGVPMARLKRRDGVVKDMGRIVLPMRDTATAVGKAVQP